MLNSLICPVCGTPLARTEDGKSLRCRGGAKGQKMPRQHCFDFSAAGYVNLCPPSQSLSGDSREAVRSRTRFLDTGHYAPIRDALCETVKAHAAPGLLVDAGCGEGYYTAALANCATEVLGLDLSKFGIDAAAKRVRRAGLANALMTVAGIYDIPLADGSADVVTSLFAPCAEEEFLRILRPGGILVIVGAGENHLLGLKRALYDEVYKNTDRADRPRAFEFLERREVSYEITLEENETIRDLFSMTPYYFRTGPKDLAKLDGLNTLTTEVHAFLEVYRRP